MKRPGNSARDTGSIYLTPYKTYGGTIQVKVQGVLDWPPGINTLCASLSATSMFVTFLIPNEIVYL